MSSPSLILLVLFTSGCALLHVLASRPPKAPKMPSFCPTAVFGFADSLSDTGNRNWEAENATIAGSFPYGVTLGQPTGRYSDGYVLIDYLVQELGLEDISLPSNAYNGSFFRSLNFAYAGATVVTVDSPIFSWHNFSLQVQDFLKHKHRMERNFPKQNQAWFEQALYYIQIGGDDINANILNGPDVVLNVSIPNAVSGIRLNIVDLHAAGAKNFLLFNMPAAGCTPNYLNLTTMFPPGILQYDDMGCIAFVNGYAQTFNSKMEALTEELRSDYPDMNIYYFDWYAANMEVLANLPKYGFTNWTQACCGVGSVQRTNEYNCGDVLCGCASHPGYTVCKDPQNYVTFDGIHFSQQFSKIMSDFILDNKFLTPHVKFVGGCQVPIPFAPDPDFNTPI